MPRARRGEESGTAEQRIRPCLAPPPARIQTAFDRFSRKNRGTRAVSGEHPLFFLPEDSEVVEATLDMWPGYARIMASRSARVHGTLTSWNDDRGFGFISPDGDTGSVGRSSTFVHITEFAAPLTRRPRVGDALTFELGRSVEGKRQATIVQIAGAPTTAKQRQPASRRQSKSRSADYLPITAFAIGYLVVNAIWPLPIWVAAIYLAASILTFVAYARDKSAATAGRWRIPESTLLLLGFLGGWPGAIVAQQVFRHKTRKASFRRAFWASVVANILVFTVLGTPALAVLFPSIAPA